MDLNREARISAEFDRLASFYEDIAENQRAIVDPLLHNAAFMRVTLEDLQQTIAEEGAIEGYQNGENQHGVKQSAALQGYNSLIKNYVTVIKSLQQLLPSWKVPMPVWRPKEKTQQEREAERQREEERQRKIREEIARAAAWQKQQREKLHAD